MVVWNFDLDHGFATVVWKLKESGWSIVSTIFIQVSCAESLPPGPLPGVFVQVAHRYHEV